MVLGENIESIGESAFHNCENLSKIIVNEKLQTVDDFAFLNTDMGKIFDVPSASVWAAISFSSHAHPIGYVIYINGIHSYELTISGEKEVIRKYAFEDYYKVNSVIIENGIKTIEFYAFKGCDYLTEVTIPKSVTSIDKNAFYDSWRLETIYYEGTIAEWKALCKKTSLYISDVTVICSDGTTEAKYW